MPESPASYEKRDLHVKAILIFCISLILALIATLFVSSWFEQAASAYFPGESPNRIAESWPEFPAPDLQANPRQEMQAYREEQETILTTYAWLDRETGRVRIPVQRAMEILAERGLPAEPHPQEADSR